MIWKFLVFLLRHEWKLQAVIQLIGVGVYLFLLHSQWFIAFLIFFLFFLHLDYLKENNE